MSGTRSASVPCGGGRESRSGRNSWRGGSGSSYPRMTRLALEPVSRLTLLALEAGDVQPQVVDQSPADQPAHGVWQPIGRAHDLGHAGPIGAFEQPHDV